MRIVKAVKCLDGHTPDRIIGLWDFSCRGGHSPVKKSSLRGLQKNCNCCSSEVSLLVFIFFLLLLHVICRYGVFTPLQNLMLFLKFRNYKNQNRCVPVCGKEVWLGIYFFNFQNLLGNSCWLVLWITKIFIKWLKHH